MTRRGTKKIDYKEKPLTKRRARTQKKRYDTPSSSEDDSDNKLADSLRSQGLYLKEIEGDGNCLFRSISDQLYSTQNHHIELRNKTLTHLKENRDMYLPFFPSEGENDFDSHLKRIGNPGVFAGNSELVALARVLGIKVFVYQYDGNVLVIEGNEENDDKEKSENKSEELDVEKPCPTVRVAYHSYEHYSSVCKINSDEEEEEKIPLSPQAAAIIEPKIDKNLMKKVELIKKRVKCEDTEQIIELLLENKNNTRVVINKLLKEFNMEEKERPRGSKKGKIPEKDEENKENKMEEVNVQENEENSESKEKVQEVNVNNIKNSNEKSTLSAISYNNNASSENKLLEDSLVQGIKLKKVESPKKSKINRKDRIAERNQLQQLINRKVKEFGDKQQVKSNDGKEKDVKFIGI